MHLVGFAGYLGSGKTTAARMLIEYAHMERQKGRKIAYADPLKELVTNAFPWLPKDAFTGTQAQKEAPLVMYPDWTGRKIMQRLGTEFFRGIDPQIWVKHLARQVDEFRKDKYYDIIVVDDVRFPDEVAAIQHLGGLVYRVNRGHCTSDHASEAHIATLKVDADIDNHGSLADLRGAIAAQVSLKGTPHV